MTDFRDAGADGLAGGGTPRPHVHVDSQTPEFVQVVNKARNVLLAEAKGDKLS